MSQEISKLVLVPGLTPWKGMIVPRFGLRMTIAERRFLLVFIDLLLINGSLLAAMTMWNGFVPSISAVLACAKWFVTLSIVWFWLGTVLDIYSLARSASVTSITISVGVAVLVTALVYVFIPWLTPPMNARLYVFGFVLFSEVTLIVWRFIYAKALNHLAFMRRVLVLGTGELAQALMRDLNQASHADDANPFRGSGYQVVGLLADKPTRLSGDNAEFRVLGDVSQLVRLARLYHVDEVIIALDDQRALEPDVYQVLLDCRELGLRTSSVSEVYERLTSRLPVEYARYDLQTLLGQADSPADRLYLASKSLIDLLFAMVGLIVLALVTPLVALGNAIWSPGPLFYRQERVGRGGRPFAVCKFRSMRVDAEKTGAVWSGDADPRITPMGRWLRKSRLDELPQVLNVLRGEMSVVGPRPERPHFVGQLVHELPLYRARNAVKPGITGWAQIRYRYGSSVEDSRIKLEYDLYYVKHASLYLDLLIMLQTAPVMLGLKGK